MASTLLGAVLLLGAAPSAGAFVYNTEAAMRRLEFEFDMGTEASFDVTSAAALEFVARLDRVQAQLSLDSEALIHFGEKKPGKRYLFFSHHKAGTRLSMGFGVDMAMILRIPYLQIRFPQVENNDPRAWCPMRGNTMISMYEDMRLPMMQGILGNCSGVRALHLVRDPRDMVLSNYIYRKKLSEDAMESSWDIMKGREYREHSTEWGINDSCDNVKTAYAPQMLDVHDAAKGVDSILEVRFESFQADFAGTVKTMYEHFLGKGFGRGTMLRLAAKRNDVNRWNPNKKSSDPHIARKGETEEAKRVFREMAERGDPCLAWMEQAANKLGYS